MQNFFLLLLFLNFLSAKTLEVGSQSLYMLKNYIEYTLADELNESVDSLRERQWQKNKNSFNSLINLDKAYWVRFKIKNLSSFENQYYIKSENQFTYHIQFYLLKKGKIVKHIEDGFISKNRDRVFNTNHMIFPLLLEGNEDLEVYFKIRNYNKIDIDFRLVTKEYLINFYQDYSLVEGVFFGGMLIMIFYNLFLYFLLKLQVYLYYVSYTFWLIIYFMGLFGFSQRYFSDYTWIFSISSGAFFISLTLFVQSILNLRQQLPFINKILNFFIFYFLVGTAMNIWVLEMKAFWYAQLVFNLYFVVVSLFGMIIIFSTYYLAFYKNDVIAKFYSFVWTLIAFVGLLLPLVYLNLIQIEIHSDYILQFLILIEVLCFSFILALKIKVVEQEKKEQTKLLVQQNKLASMGEMISAIAHQWRQPLSEINGVILSLDVDYKKENLSPDIFNQHLDNLEITTSYLSNTIHDFMDFFQQNKRREEVYISEIIQNALKLVSVSHAHNVEIVYEKGLDIKINTYKSELIQALLIVINNAMDACVNNKLKFSRIILKTLIEKRSVSIYIIDNGKGIDPSLLEKIYTPYFTTKHKSKGTGLGLYILKMIIEGNMKGKINMQSSKNGTNCELVIPLKCE